MSSLLTFALGTMIGIPLGWAMFAVFTVGKRADVMDQDFTGDTDL